MPLFAAARALLALTLLPLALAGCVTGQEVARDLPPGISIDFPPGTPARFVEAAGRIEPMAETMCRARVRGRNCNFTIALDARPGQPANAFQTLDPYGRPWLFVTSALIAKARNSDELAFVMGHEAAHHIAGHIPRRDSQAREGAMLAGVLATQAGASPDEVKRAQQTGAELAAQSYSKAFELEADALGAEIAWRAGFDPVRGAVFFLRLPDPGVTAHGSHPSNAQRRAVVARVVAALQAGGAV